MNTYERLKFLISSNGKKLIDGDGRALTIFYKNGLAYRMELIDGDIYVFDNMAQWWYLLTPLNDLYISHRSAIYKVNNKREQVFDTLIKAYSAGKKDVIVENLGDYTEVVV